MAGQAKAPRKRAEVREQGATTQEVAEFLRLDPHTLENWRSLGKGPTPRKVGRRVLYDWADVYAWYDSQAKGAA